MVNSEEHMSVEFKKFVCQGCKFGKKNPCVLLVEYSAINPEFCPWGYEEVEWEGSAEKEES